MKIKIVDTKYLELVDHEKNHYKFYRMIKLDNGQWIQQNGRIGTRGISRIFSLTSHPFYDKLEEKLNKGYAYVADPHDDDIKLGLQKFGLDEDDSLDDEDDSFVDDAQEDKIKRILDKLGRLIKEVQSGAETITVTNIYNQVKQQHIFTSVDIEIINNLARKYDLV